MKTFIIKRGLTSGAATLTLGHTHTHTHMYTHTHTYTHRLRLYEIEKHPGVNRSGTIRVNHILHSSEDILYGALFSSQLEFQVKNESTSYILHTYVMQL